jgi:hypothetical protein
MFFWIEIILIDTQIQRGTCSFSESFMSFHFTIEKDESGGWFWSDSSPVEMRSWIQNGYSVDWRTSWVFWEFFALGPPWYQIYPWERLTRMSQTESPIIILLSWGFFILMSKSSRVVNTSGSHVATNLMKNFDDLSHSQRIFQWKEVTWRNKFRNIMENMLNINNRLHTRDRVKVLQL